MEYFGHIAYPYNGPLTALQIETVVKIKPKNLGNTTNHAGVFASTTAPTFYGDLQIVWLVKKHEQSDYVIVTYRNDEPLKIRSKSKIQINTLVYTKINL